MTGADLITEVLAGGRVSASRPRILTVLNFRYGTLLSLEEWTFLKGTFASVFTGGSRTVTVPTDLGIPRHLYLADGTDLDSLDVEDFWDREQGNTSTGTPRHFTAPGDGTLLAGPIPDTTQTGLLTYEKAMTALTDDSDSVPVTPEWSHLALIAGVEAFMITRENDPTAQGLEQIFQQSIDAMRRTCLAAARGVRRQFPRAPEYR